MDQGDVIEVDVNQLHPAILSSTTCKINFVMKFGMDKVYRAQEDPTNTGNGQFTDDIQLPTNCICVCCDPHAHGRITELDVSNVLAMPGVHGVYTAQDITQLGPLRAGRSLKMPTASLRSFRDDRFG